MHVLKITRNLFKMVSQWLFNILTQFDKNWRLEIFLYCSTAWVMQEIRIEDRI